MIKVIDKYIKRVDGFNLDRFYHWGVFYKLSYNSKIVYAVGLHHIYLEARQHFKKLVHFNLESFEWWEREWSSSFSHYLSLKKLLK